MKDEDLQNVVSVKPKDKRWRFVLATNIAETSITIPGVTYVFDSLLENYSFSDNNDIISLKMGFISKSSANQRAGRTGRDSNGVVVRFCYENFFNSLDENRQNEINRLSITNEVLKAMNSQIDTTRLFPNLLKYHPHVFEELQTLNCIEKNKNVYTVTKMGTFVSEIPLSIRYGIFLYNWVKIADPFPGIVLSVLLEMSNSIFLTNVSENIKSNVPLGTLLNPILKLWTKYPNLNPSRKKIVKFANENNLNVDGIVESIRKIFEIIRILVIKIGDIDIFMFEPSSCIDITKSIIMKSFQKFKKNRNNKYIRVDSDDNIEYELSKKLLAPGPIYPNIIYSFFIVKRGISYIIEWFPEDQFSISSLNDDLYDLNPEKINDDENEDEEIIDDDIEMPIQSFHNEEKEEEDFI